MRLLVIAGGLEADRLGKAASAAGWDADAVESVDAGVAWLGTRRADVLVLSTRAAGIVLAEQCRALRSLPNGKVPFVCVCGAAEMAVVQKLVDACVPRPASADDVMRRVRALIEGGGKRRTTSGMAVVTTAANALPGSFDEATRPRNTGALLKQLAASMDEVLDAGMSDAARDDLADASAEFSTSHKTAETPREIIDTILAGAASDTEKSLEDEGLIGDAKTVVDPRLSGDLADQDLPMLVGRMYVEGLTGCLTVHRGEVEKMIFFEAGRPVVASSTDVADRMIEMLIRERRISRAQYDQAQRAVAETGRRMGALLIDLNILKSSELLPAVRQHYEEILLSLFAWDEGQWAFAPGAIAEPHRVRLLRHSAVLVDEGLRRGYPIERVRARLGSPKNVFRLQTRGGAAEVLLEIGVDMAEKRMPLLFDGIRTFEEVVRASGVAEEKVSRLALVLLVFGILLPGSARPGSDMPGGGADVRDQEIERTRILARHALVLEGDYFQIFGVEREAETQDLWRAYESLLRELAPEMTGPALARELQNEIASIREVLDEGMRVLGDERLRGQYQARLQ